MAAFDYQKPSSSHSSTSSSSSLMNERAARVCSSSSPSSPINRSGNGLSTSRSMTPSLSFSDSMHYGSRGVENDTPVELGSAEQSIEERSDAVRSGDSISVTVRFRPLSEREFQRGDEIVWYPDGDDTVRSEYNPATAYAFDRVFGPSTTSQTVYDVAARPVIRSAMEGVNGTVFAYGVTSSGKTHTMHGDQISPGIIPLAIMDVFNIIQDTPGREFLLRVSYLEIYNEVINDLLDPTGHNLRVREDAQGTYVEGIKDEVVLSPGHALSFVAAGEEHRHVGSNNFNLMSSRSHTIFTLMIESSACGDEYDGVIFSQLNLIDLAGSESSKTETTGLRRKEGSYINKSLLTLGTVIGKLSEGKASHVPYRDSKLTRLLQSSLSGHGHVSLICTVTPASSSMEETHNTLKFASRAKRVEIYASCNRIVDEKSLIKKYQREISILRQELDHLKKGILVGVSNEEIMSLRQKLEEGQVKMQSRLEEEEEEKAALMSRIQRLTKLILVSTKNRIPGLLSDIPSHQQCHFGGEDGKLGILSESSPPLVEHEKNDHPPSSLLVSPETSFDLNHTRSSTKLSEQQSQFNDLITESTQAGEPVEEIAGGSRLQIDGITMSDQMDLIAEQVKMLAGEIAFDTSTLKRLVEQSKSDPDGSQTQVQNLELEIHEKRRQMRVLEQHILESRETSIANTSLVDMQQTVTRLITQCHEKDFDLEIKSADNRVLQEQLQNKCSENEDLQEKLLLVQQQLASTLSSDQGASMEYINELKKKIQSQEIVNEKLNREHVQFMEEISGLHVQNQKLAEEASYAKELASAAAVELKNLASEITKLSLQNARQAKELLAAKEMSYPRGAGTHLEFKSNNIKHGRKGQITGRGNEIQGTIYDDAKFMNIDHDDMKIELQTRKQREAVLEAALAEKKLAEDEYRKKIDEAMKKEVALETDLANMWVLVAKLKKEGGDVKENVHERPIDEANIVNGLKTNVDENKITVLEEIQVSDTKKLSNDGPELEPLVTRLKARMQEMKEKKFGSMKNGDDNSHICKVCFEAPTAALLQPCRHYCLCKPCSFACSECPVCRSNIADRIFAYPS